MKMSSLDIFFCTPGLVTPTLGWAGRPQAWEKSWPLGDEGVCLFQSEMN